MTKDYNKWTRERTFWEKNGAEIGIIAVCLVFGGLMIAATAFVLFKPETGIGKIFEAPPPPVPTGPSPDQKFHYSVPGETEVLIYPGKPVILPPPAPEKPEKPVTSR